MMKCFMFILINFVCDIKFFKFISEIVIAIIIIKRGRQCKAERE